MSFDLTLRQIHSFIAVYEEGSFTRAAEREHATQSGISQHVAAIERALGVRLFERMATGVSPTAIARRFYERCIEVVSTLETAARDTSAMAGNITGNLRIGLMPTFTRAALAPALEYFLRRYREVRIQVHEDYSANLTSRVLEDKLDFAVVPSSEGQLGLRSRLIARDREMLLSGAARGLDRLFPIRLADCSPLKIVVPTELNMRRRNLETYFRTNGIKIAEMIEMDAMIGTLEFVASSDWVTILPSLICPQNMRNGPLIVNPIVGPSLFAEYVLIEPARKPLSAQAQLFVERLESEVARILRTWEQALAHLKLAPAGQELVRPPRSGRSKIGRAATVRGRAKRRRAIKQTDRAAK